MPQFNWDNSYSVKVKRFDGDHQQLFRILNELCAAMAAGQGQTVIQRVLQQLLQYTEKHFSAEEAVMKSTGYPQFQAQVDQHRKFTAKIKEISDKCKAGSLGLTVEVFDFLTDWLKQHIVGMDKQYSEFLNAKGIA
jgi:hemerythrin